MKKYFLFFIIFCLACPAAMFPAAPADAKLYLAEPVLVTQPSYAGMRFYVYKPYDLPKNWYATFDGYPVVKNSDGVWVYGTYAGPNLVPTHYVVGSVVPSAAGLSPYANPVQISSVSTLPQLVTQQLPLIAPPPSIEQPMAEAMPLEASMVPGHPEAPMMAPPHALELSTYVPDWLFNGRFMALGRWKDSVDRLGILRGPNVPVAWSGNNPKVIYAWNGHMWYQMMARENENPARVLKNNLYTITKQVNNNGFVWYEADMPVLSQQAGEWGYYWMGEVMPR